jgi:hypothetical protein
VIKKAATEGVLSQAAGHQDIQVNQQMVYRHHLSGVYRFPACHIVFKNFANQKLKAMLQQH